MSEEGQQVNPTVGASTHWALEYLEKGFSHYKCHKEVVALKINSIDERPTSPFDIAGVNAYVETSKGEDIYFFSVDYLDKHEPKAGGYLVIYQDGYRSYSPAAIFEKGYTELKYKKEGE